MLEQTNTFIGGAIVNRLRADVEDLFAIKNIRIPQKAPQGSLIFEGELLTTDSEAAYSIITQRWLAHNYTPMLRKGDETIELVAQPGIVKPKPGDYRINLALFIVTVAAVLYVGAINEGADPFTEPGAIWAGLPFALSFLAILGTHEFGHFFAAKYHKVAVTLPYFIPFPTIWGTLGAFIQLRSPTVNRRQLFDVGVAGPIAGLVVAVPVLIIGLMNSTVQPLPINEPYMLEGNSIVYFLTKWAVFGQVLPANGIDVFLHPMAWAGWSGLLITALNLIPVGQLDGGHVAYVLFGRRARAVGMAVVIILIVVGLAYWRGWLFWALMIFLMIGFNHPPPLNELAPLGLKRKVVGYLMIAVLILLFTPNPIQLFGV